jgi:glycosyltransferase involved in cell wall biosynthesis
MPTPLVSVLIDTYNHVRFIEQSLESVFAQDFPAADLEVLVVDDGSTDGTAELLRKWEPKIRVLRKRNGGQASAFNFGIPECKGEIVAFLDADDWWAPSKLTRVVGALDEDPQIGFVGNGIVTVFQDGTTTTQSLRDGFRFQANTLEGALLFRRREAFMGTSRMTIRKALLEQIGQVPEEVRIQADEFLYTMAAALMPMRILPEPLTYYRIHGDNGFIVTGNSPERLRNKQLSLEALARGLSLRLAEARVGPEVRGAILSYTQATADQLRLTLDGGWPWETVGVEWKMYQVAHPDAALPQRLFKSVALLTALFVSPKRFYSFRNEISRNPLYRRLRDRWLPFLEMKHIDHSNEGAAGTR